MYKYKFLTNIIKQSNHR